MRAERGKIFAGLSSLLFGAVLVTAGVYLAALGPGLRPDEERAAQVALGAGLMVSAALAGLAAELLSRRLGALVDHAHRHAGAPMDSARVGGDPLGGVTVAIEALAAERDGARTELERNHDRLDTVLESTNDAVLVLDEDDRIVLANGAAGELLDLTTRGPMPSMLEVVGAPALVDLLESCRDQGGAVAEFDMREGQRVKARATSLQESDGVVLTMLDVTRMRRLETVRRDFVANVSHELRTPVSVILANAETLQSGALAEPERAAAFLEAIHRNAKRLTILIGDLLDLSRLEAGKAHIKVKMLELAPLVARAIESVSATAEPQGQTVVNEVQPGLGGRADPDALHQILVNLLDNAVKYSGAGSTITVTSEQGKRRVRIVVADDGPGIEPHHRLRIFERFYRVDPGRSRAVGGTGLGLSIVRHLAESMDGRVGVMPAEPRGVAFWVQLRRKSKRKAEPT